MTATDALASFACGLSPHALPAEVVRSTKRHLLDVLGVALASSQHTFARAALRAACALSPSGSETVIGGHERLPAAWAAFVNGTYAHGIDFDDTHTASVVHVSCSVAPTALAVAEARGTSGTDFLCALALGMEANVRLGLVARGAFHDRGFHPTGICGTFASALVAGKLAGLSLLQMTHALGLCGSTAAGSLECLSDGTWAKRTHGGWAAHAGITAAALAEHDFTGPAGALDGRFGLYRTHIGDTGWDLGTLSDTIGTRWQMLDTALKPYPCCHFNHAFIDCAAELRRTCQIGAEEVAAVDCFVAERQMPIVCEPRETKQRPQSPYDAKFSLPYAVACMLVRGHVGIDDFSDSAIRDPKILDLCTRITCHPDRNADYPRHFPGHLRIRTTDGRCFEQREPVHRGSPEHPLDERDIAEKFRSNAARALRVEKIDAVLAALEELDAAPGVAALLRACTPDEATP